MVSIPPAARLRCLRYADTGLGCGHAAEVVCNICDCWCVCVCVCVCVCACVCVCQVARGLGHLAATGWKPDRSIVLASWDAEEYGLVRGGVCLVVAFV